MVTNLVRRLVIVWAIGLAPVAGFAQEAAVIGTVTDSTAAVIPGVLITAVHEASGNTFESVTDAHGVYRIPTRAGAYRLTAQLDGFATATRTFELLVGQQATINLEMLPSTVEVSVNVTGEAPLLDMSQSRISGNVDSRQMQELPVNGRNWQALSMLAPGSRNNSVDEAPVPRAFGDFQLNVDGQQVTDTLSRGGGRATSIQPGRHRRIRVRVQSLRCHTGTVERCADQRDYKIRHEYLRRVCGRVRSERPLQRR